MKRVILAIFFLAAIFFGGYYYLSIRPEENGIENYPEPTRDPDRTIREFYDWYLGFKGHPLFSGAYKTKGLLSEKLVVKLENLIASGLKQDPVLCYEERPYKYSIQDVVTEEDTANALLILNYYGVLVRARVELTKIRGEWLLSDITCLEKEKTEIEEGRMMDVVVYFYNRSKDPISKQFTIESVYSVARRVDIEKGVYVETIRELFKGPNNAELVQGYSTKLPDISVLKDVIVSNNIAYVNFSGSIKDAIGEEGFETSIDAMTTQIGQTFKQFREVSGTYYAINGNIRDFYDWSGLGCPTQESIDNGAFDYCNETGVFERMDIVIEE